MNQSKRILCEYIPRTGFGWLKVHFIINMRKFAVSHT